MTFTRCFVFALCLSAVATPGLAQDRMPEKDPAKTSPKKVVPFNGETLLRRLMARYSKLQDYACTVTEMRQIGSMTIRSVKTIKWKSGGKLHSTIERTTPRSGTIKSRVVCDGVRGLFYQANPNPFYMELPKSSPMIKQVEPVLLSLLSGDPAMIRALGSNLSARRFQQGVTKYERLTIRSPIGVVINYDFRASDGALMRSEQSLKLPGMDSAKAKDSTLARGVKVVTQYTKVKVNQGLTDKQFVVRVPEGARKIVVGGKGRGGVPKLPPISKNGGR